MDKKPIQIDWEPQPRQLACLKACGLSFPFDKTPLHTSLADIVGYGGSAGGGKTDTLLEVGHVAALHYPKLNIGYFRREFPQLEGPGGAIMRSMELFTGTGKYNEQKHRWTFLNNSILQFCHCKDAKDVYNYQSQQFDILLVDEVTQFERDMVKYLLTRNRATVDFPTFRPFAAFGTNPGNVGHQYFKDEFVLIGEPEKVHIFMNEVGKPESHIFIPSKLEDNKILMDRDPGYADRVGNTELNRKILLEGSWDVFAGQALAELRRDIHIIKDFEIPSHWNCFGAYDQGFNHPFSFGIFANDQEGNTYLVRRVTSRLKRPDEVARLMGEACDVIGGIDKLDYIVAGWDCWLRGRDGGVSIAEQFMKSTPRILLRKASEDRIQGVAQVRRYIAWKEKDKDKEGKPIDGKPMFYIFESASGVYDTLTRMIFDTDGPKPEDVKKVDADENGLGGDDDYDMVRYGLMSRPRLTKQKEIPPPPNTFDSYLRKMQEERLLREEYVGY